MWRKTLPYMLTTLLLGLCCLASSRADVVMEMFRSADAALRNEIKNRGVAREKVAPIQNDTGTPQVAVHASFAVLSVPSVDDAKQRMMAGLFLQLQCRDPMLAWNLAEYAGVEYVELPVDAAWTPDIRIVNSYIDLYLVESTKTLFLDHTGEINVFLPVLAKVYCVMDLFYYPYDEQVCPFFFTFSGFLNITSHLDLHSPAAVADVTSLSNEWTLIGTKLEVYSTDGGRSVFPKLLIRLRRKTAFYTVCLVVPMMVTSYMNPLVFLLPLHCGEKVSFLVAIFLSTSVYFSYFTSVMPRGLDELPKVMTFLVGVLVQSVLTFLATILVLRLQNHPAPTISRHSYLHSPDLPLSLQASSSPDTSPTTTISTTASSESDAIPQDSSSTKFPRHYQPGDGKMSTVERAAAPAAASSAVVLWGWSLTLDRLKKAFFSFSFVGNTVFLLCMYFMKKE